MRAAWTVVADDDSTLAGDPQSGILLLNPGDSDTTINYVLTGAAQPSAGFGRFALCSQAGKPGQHHCRPREV